MESKNYKINYYGNLSTIKNTKTILALFKSGSGYNEGSRYYGGSMYELYLPNKEDWGKTLIKVGEGQSFFNGDSVSCQFTLHGKKYKIEDFVIDNLFMRIFPSE